MLLTTRFLEVAKFTNLTPLSLPKLIPYFFFPTSYTISFYFILFAQPYEFTLYYF